MVSHRTCPVLPCELVSPVVVPDESLPSVPPLVDTAFVGDATESLPQATAATTATAAANVPTQTIRCIARPPECCVGMTSPAGDTSGPALTSRARWLRVGRRRGRMWRAGRAELLHVGAHASRDGCFGCLAVADVRFDFAAQRHEPRLGRA